MTMLMMQTGTTEEGETTDSDEQVRVSANDI